jgi:hypothetical protein
MLYGPPLSSIPDHRDCGAKLSLVVSDRIGVEGWKNGRALRLMELFPLVIPIAGMCLVSPSTDPSDAGGKVVLLSLTKTAIARFQEPRMRQLIHAYRETAEAATQQQ